ncbi:interleukin-10 receptor subunit beta isoform X1 [Pimephales promelas]|uniref:interleukin-10 receptor subunit beta isoform X1 n=1 Tax=Pimephales promelas TaxID=90988 RepID=UPI0019556570|nr:interleukin-10 receptor subunit beta isoform X1 [Pimephales promelas]
MYLLIFWVLSVFVAVYGGTESSIISCVPKNDEGLTGLDPHETLADGSGLQNVSVVSLNTQYVLRWAWADDPHTINGTPTFTAQYLSAVYSRRAPHKQVWRTVCADVQERRCDFTDAGLSYWGIYLLRVRVNTAPPSDWTSITFCPDKDADLGPPSSVKLTSGEGDLEIAIDDPLTSNNESMRTLVQDMQYVIQYWRRPEGYQTAEVLKTQNNVVTLSALDRWTWYCVRVQSRYDFYNKRSVFSNTHCARTEGLTPYWQICLYFLLSLVLSFLLGLLLWFSFYGVKFVKSIFYPNVQLPPHIQELWLSDSETPHLLPPPRSSSVWDQLDVSAETDTIPDRQMSSAEDQDSGVPSRHGSGDSGFSSTEEDSSVRPLRSTHTDHRCKTDTLHREEMHDGTLEIYANS